MQGSRGILADSCLAAGFSLLIAAAANIAIPLPFTPVPVTLQTLAVLLAASALGRRRGALAVLLYLAEGAAGLPVFSGGRAGIAMILGPTGGYLLGFIPAAIVVGFCSEHGWMRGAGGRAAALLLGSIALYVPGLIWLAGFIGAAKAVPLGLLPFLAGDVLKLAIGCAALEGAVLIRARRG